VTTVNFSFWHRTHSPSLFLLKLLLEFSISFWESSLRINKDKSKSKCLPSQHVRSCDHSDITPFSYVNSLWTQNVEQVERRQFKCGSLGKPYTSGFSILEKKRAVYFFAVYSCVLYSVWNSLFSRDVMPLHCHDAKCRWRAGSEFLYLGSTITHSKCLCFASFMVAQIDQTTRSFYRVPKVVVHKRGKYKKLTEKHWGKNALQTYVCGREEPNGKCLCVCTVITSSNVS